MSNAPGQFCTTAVIAAWITSLAICGCATPRGTVTTRTGNPTGLFSKRNATKPVTSSTPKAVVERSPIQTAPASASPNSPGIQTVADVSGTAGEMIRAEHREWAEERVAAEARIAGLEGQIAWLRDDIARMQQLLNNAQQNAGTPQQRDGELLREQAALRKYVADLRLAVDAAQQSSAAQQTTIDGLTRRVGYLESTLKDEHAREIRALDGVIGGMERLIQLQDEQSKRARHAGQEPGDAKR